LLHAKGSSAGGLQVVRSSLLPGILKTVGHNKDSPRPIKLFEVSDIVRLDTEEDVGAANHRHLAALYCNLNSGFEVIPWFLSMLLLAVGSCTSLSPLFYFATLKYI
jgi:phenylalanyl-tRNA synthetase beta chain